MDQAQMFQQKKFGGGAAVCPPPPPGLGMGGAEVKKAMFGPDAKAPPQARPMGIKPKTVQWLDGQADQEVKRVSYGLQAIALARLAGVAAAHAKDSQPKPAITGLHCVECGTKVPQKLLGAKGLRFCTHCGHEHPQKALKIAVNAANASAAQSEDPAKVSVHAANASAMPSGDHTRLLSLHKKVETLHSVDLLAQLLTTCNAQLALAGQSLCHAGAQRAQWDGAPQAELPSGGEPGGGWHPVQRQGQHGASWENASPAYVYAGPSVQYFESSV